MINTPKYIQLGLFAMAFLTKLSWYHFRNSNIPHFCYVTVFITSLLILLFANFAHFRTFWTQTVFFQTKSCVSRLKPYAWKSNSHFCQFFELERYRSEPKIDVFRNHRFLIFKIWSHFWYFSLLNETIRFFILKWNKNNKFSWVILGPQEWIIKNWISVFLICCRYKFLSCECLITFCIRF